ncbi:hypothetical protein PGT21_026017 [Puccinia graminis f. sp. tritici]|uniref:Uncharacterized protein n=1 Tax=Puccinia graminis f. sp. tritici TaxID=56615 RepID=A0A5B0NB87_PUCGR|nr:hypothetical protein PGT21_026017 [Puccinia graminis f. sp. tritici]
MRDFPKIYQISHLGNHVRDDVDGGRESLPPKFKPQTPIHRRTTTTTAIKGRPGS